MDDVTRIIARQRRARVFMLALVPLGLALGVVNILTGHLLWLITNLGLAGLCLINRTMAGVNIQLAEHNAELTRQLHPAVVRERELTIARLERELGIGGAHGRP